MCTTGTTKRNAESVRVGVRVCGCVGVGAWGRVRGCACVGARAWVRVRCACGCVGVRVGVRGGCACVWVCVRARVWVWVFGWVCGG